ncbi:transposase [Kiritimatiella glycovorans]|uniref:Transposase n=1 Tax=Kiritimatiella glycovorans TaxID=1307763 RepID=A0A0G3EFJ9_9BACT|nr:transposase [Kiritimatiella glycovorans]AKJ65123.1 Transposase [Kiritimatiella glycovorans]
MVTAGIYQKRPILNTPEKRTLVMKQLFESANHFGWRLQAWAVMINHYHFAALSPEDPSNLTRMISSIHKWTALELNRIDGMRGRRVWHNYRETHVTFQTSWLARLRYIHQNPVHHGLTDHAASYRWCSQAWLEQKANRAFVHTLSRIKTDRIHVADEF